MCLLQAIVFIQFVLRTAGSVFQHVPCASQLQDLPGNSYLKIQGSSPVIAKLICNCSKPSVSLANGTRLAELKKSRNEQLQAQPFKKARAEQIVEIAVEDSSVHILSPGKRAASADLMVALKEDQLFTVFKYLAPDCQDGSKSNRSYKRSGNFVGSARKRGRSHG